MVGKLLEWTRRKSDVVDDLVKLADGDTDLVRRAIDQAAAGKTVADLEDVVGMIVAMKAEAAAAGMAAK